MLGAPSSQPTVPLHELPPTRLVIHQQTSAHERRKWTRNVQSRSGILAYLCTRQHWLWITVELHIPARATGRLLLGREVATLLYGEFWASWSVTAAQECRCRVPGSISSGLTCSRTGLASGHSRHPVMQGSLPAHRTPRPCLRTTSQI